MSNMSYCMFENTFKDLQDCEDKLSSIGGLDVLSNVEKIYAERLIALCVRIGEEYVYLVEEGDE